MSDATSVRALVLASVGSQPSLESVGLLAPRAGEVEVEIKATGVCHSDLSVVNGVLPMPTPCVLGHEAAGVVTELGDGVTRWSKGDRVIVQWVPMCRDCESCRRGEPYLCTTYLRSAARMDDGTTRFTSNGGELSHAMNAGAFAERIVVRETGLAALPDDVPFHLGALIGCGFLTGWGAATNVARVAAGEHVAVVGAGGVGLSAAMGARAAGAASVTVVDLNDERRRTALEIDAATHEATPDRAEAVIKGVCGGRPDVVIEAVGLAAVQRAAFDLARSGGRIVFAGANPGETIELPGYGFFLMAKQALGCWFGASDPDRDVPLVTAAWREGRLPIDRLVTVRRPLDEHAEAFADLRAGNGIRTVLEP